MRDMAVRVKDGGDKLDRLVRRLSNRSPRLTEALLATADQVEERIGSHNLARWVDLGDHVSAGGWFQVGLAARFFRASPGLFEVASMDQVSRLVSAASRLAVPAPEMANVLLGDATRALGSLSPDHRDDFTDLIVAVSQRSWAETDRYMETVPSIMAAVACDAVAPLLEVTRHAVDEVGAGATSAELLEGGTLALATKAARALASLAPSTQVELARDAVVVASESGVVGLEMIASSPEVTLRLEPDAARRWREAGLELLTGPDGRDRARSWFRLEFAQSRELLSRLGGRVDLADVTGVLRLYAQALSGHELIIQPSDVLVRRGIGWTGSTRATSDGVSIFLPETIDSFVGHDDNFNAYKVYTTLQAARLSTGSFQFAWGVDGKYMPARLHLRTENARGRAPEHPPVVPFRAFYESFEDRRLAGWLLGLVEGLRIDAFVASEYRGVAPLLATVRSRESSTRPDAASLPDRQALAERLVRFALGEIVDSPDAATRDSLELLEIVRRQGATIQDSVEVASSLYDILRSIANHPPGKGRGSRAQAPEDGSSEMPFVTPDQPEILGEFKPELVQTLDLLEDAGIGAERLSREDLIDALVDSTEISADGDALERAEVEALLDALTSEAERRRLSDRSDVADTSLVSTEGSDDQEDSPKELDPSQTPGDDLLDLDEVQWFSYDEWDFRAHDYISGHCHVMEHRSPAGGADAYEEALGRHGRLIVDTRRRFEQLRPEAFRRIHRLEDGSEIDLDEAISFHADRLAGAGPLARFYTRRNKLVRDVAVALLLDLSASTKDSPRAPDRVIDIERDAAVVMAEALDAIGDTYGIWGFSGSGRSQVEVLEIKGLGDPLDDEVRGRLAGIEPMAATRMGAAIRHITAKLEDWTAKVKVLILVSDGRPQDEDYGPIRGDIEYGLHDTKRSLIEARRSNIEPFLITVDPDGHEYLGQMCGDMGYEVVADVASLPRRLPRLYRYLTAE